MNTFKPGQRVRVVTPTHSYAPIQAGMTGRVVRSSPVAHASMNGGGYDIEVILDHDPDFYERAAKHAGAMRRLGLSEDYVEQTQHWARIRSTHLEVIQ